MLKGDQLRVSGLFAGVGGIEVGLHRAGHRTDLLCEWDPAAQRVLRHRFPDVPLVGDIAELDTLPASDLVVAGFPCQDLSQAGRTAGIGGNRSGLVGHVFRLLDRAGDDVEWLLLENVSFMLSLDRGQAMDWLTTELESRGFNWAYRVVDSRAFGLPQRRQRVLLLASRNSDPRPVLLNQDRGSNVLGDHGGELGCGFYWTEGLRGLGWAVDAVPTLKGGSTIGIPSAPAIWQPGSNRLFTPDIRDAERLQGFTSDWTVLGDEVVGRKKTDRWKLIGNAVSVPVAQWLGERISTAESFSDEKGSDFAGKRWPRAAWGRRGERKQVELSMWPVNWKRPHLIDFLEYEGKALSERATAGFLNRAERGSLRIPEDFLCEAHAHLESMRPQTALIEA